ncbi:MAG: hypothetical protein AAFP13_06770 [Pseudomonadota bacterium]
MDHATNPTRIPQAGRLSRRILDALRTLSAWAAGAFSGEIDAPASSEIATRLYNHANGARRR